MSGGKYPSVVVDDANAIGSSAEATACDTASSDDSGALALGRLAQPRQCCSELPPYWNALCEQHAPARAGCDRTWKESTPAD